MSIRKVLLGLLCLASALAAQQPVITSIQNPASNILPGLPNYGTAKGQIFVIFGNNLGPATLTQPSSLPLPVSLANVTVTIGLGGANLAAPIFYVSATQIGAVMPSNTPTGNVTVQVTYNATASVPFNTPVVATNFGISTLDQTGTNGAVITDGSYNVIRPLTPAVSGRTYTMWGTGLGPANSDNNTATSGDLGTPVQVFVGGVPASVTYRGRSSGPGLDQINFTIPAGVSGCNVSLAVQTTVPGGFLISNVPTLPVSADGAPCSDTNGYSVEAVDAALAKGNLKLGSVNLNAGQNQALASFRAFSAASWPLVAAKAFPVISLGSCVTTISSGGIATTPASTPLDAGTSMTLAPPIGNAANLSDQSGVYVGTIPGISTGTYGISAPGGSDIAAFSASFAGIPAFTWTSVPAAGSVIDRTKDFTVTWQGGDANSYVDITGSAPASTVNGVSNNFVANFECQTPAATGSFAIPAQILLSMPVSAATTANGRLSLSLRSDPRPLTIPGTDLSRAFVNGAPTNLQVFYK